MPTTGRYGGSEYGSAEYGKAPSQVASQNANATLPGVASATRLVVKGAITATLSGAATVGTVLVKAVATATMVGVKAASPFIQKIGSVNLLGTATANKSIVTTAITAALAGAASATKQIQKSVSVVLAGTPSVISYQIIRALKRVLRVAVTFIGVGSPTLLDTTSHTIKRKFLAAVTCLDAEGVSVAAMSQRHYRYGLARYGTIG